MALGGVQPNKEYGFHHNLMIMSLIDIKQLLHSGTVLGTFVHCLIVPARNNNNNVIKGGSKRLIKFPKDTQLENKWQRWI